MPEDRDRRLSHLSDITHRPKSYYVREALSDYLEAHEDEIAAIAEYEKKRRSGKLKTKSLKQLMTELKLSHNDLDH